MMTPEARSADAPMVGLRISEFGLLSDFGIRPSKFFA